MNILIDQYAHGGAALRRVVHGLSHSQLRSFPVPDTWSIHQIVIHLLDSDMVLIDRMKRVIAEDNPTLIGYDEVKYASNLFYDDQPAEDAVEIFDLNRKLFTRVLRKLPAGAFKRFGTHNERGKLTLQQLLEMAVHHLEHHLKFAQSKRHKLEKPLKD